MLQKNEIQLPEESWENIFNISLYKHLETVFSESSGIIY